MHNKITCLFGYHDYSEEETEDNLGYSVHLCKHCERKGYLKWYDGDEGWFDYDEERICVHVKWRDDEEEYWYNKEGICIHVKYANGSEEWLGNNNRLTKKKPKNWKYEKCITN